MGRWLLSLTKWTRRSSLSVGLFVSVTSLIGGTADHATIPEDASLSLDAYRQIGVPSLDREWSAGDHVAAVEALGSLQPVELPRYRSPRSGRLFEKLVTSQLEVADSIWRRSHLGEDTFEVARSTPTVARLYGTPLVEGMLFDRELLEIYASSMFYVIDELDELSSRQDELKELESSGKVEGADIRELGRSRQQLKSEMEAVATGLLGQILQLAELRSTRESCRAALASRLEDLVPRIAPHLAKERLVSLARALRDLAEVPENSVVRDELMSVSLAIE